MKGSDATISGSDKKGREWERNTELRYVVQNGPLKNLSLRYRNASFRSDFSRDLDENRFIIAYTIPLK